MHLAIRPLRLWRNNRTITRLRYKYFREMSFKDYELETSSIAQPGGFETSLPFGTIPRFSFVDGANVGHGRTGERWLSGRPEDSGAPARAQGEPTGRVRYVARLPTSSNVQRSGDDRGKVWEQVRSPHHGVLGRVPSPGAGANWFLPGSGIRG